MQRDASRACWRASTSGRAGTRPRIRVKASVVALATVASPFLGRLARRVAWVLAGCVSQRASRAWGQRLASPGADRTLRAHASLRRDPGRPLMHARQRSRARQRPPTGAAAPTGSIAGVWALIAACLGPAHAGPAAESGTQAASTAPPSPRRPRQAGPGACCRRAARRSPAPRQRPCLPGNGGASDDPGQRRSGLDGPCPRTGLQHPLVEPVAGAQLRRTLKLLLLATSSTSTSSCRRPSGSVNSTANRARSPRTKACRTPWAVASLRAR